MSKTRTRKQLEMAGKDLQKALGCRPRIDLSADDEILKAKIIEEAEETMITDRLKHSTWKLLGQFEVGARYSAEKEEGMNENDIDELVVFAEDEKREKSPVTLPDRDWDDMSQKEQAYVYFIKGARTATELTEALPNMAIGSIRAYVSQWNRDEGPPKNYPYPSVWDNRSNEGDDEEPEVDDEKDDTAETKNTDESVVEEVEETMEEKKETQKDTKESEEVVEEVVEETVEETVEEATESKKDNKEEDRSEEKEIASESKQTVLREYRGYDDESFFENMVAVIQCHNTNLFPKYSILTSTTGGKSQEDFEPSHVSGINSFQSMETIKALVKQEKLFLSKIEEAIERGPVDFSQGETNEDI